MERKVGEVFEHNGVKLKVREFTHADGFTCENCFFFGGIMDCMEDEQVVGDCSAFDRVDCIDVIFEEVKV